MGSCRSSCTIFERQPVKTDGISCLSLCKNSLNSNLIMFLYNEAEKNPPNTEHLVIILFPTIFLLLFKIFSILFLPYMDSDPLIIHSESLCFGACSPHSCLPEQLTSFDRHVSL